MFICVSFSTISGFRDFLAESCSLPSILLGIFRPPAKIFFFLGGGGVRVGGWLICFALSNLLCCRTNQIGEKRVIMSEEHPASSKQETKPKVTKSGGGSSQEASVDTGEVICLKVRDQNGAEMSFRVRRSATLKKMMDVYCEKRQLIQNSIQFTMDGDRVLPENTPAELDLEDGDVLEVFSHQEGGH